MSHRTLHRLAALGLLTLTLHGAGHAAGGSGPLPASPPPTLNDPIFPTLGQRGLDVRHYDLALTVPRPGSPELRGVVTLTLGSTEPLSHIRLDFVGPQVGAVRWNGQAVPFLVEGEAQKLTVMPPAPLRPGQEARLTVEYAGAPGDVTDPDLGLRLGWLSVPAADTNFALSEPHGTHTFVPSNDHPGDKATFTTRITVPAGFTAAASGVEGTPVPGAEGQRTFVFTQAQPIPTYALGLHVGRLGKVTLPGVSVGVNGSAVARRDSFPVGTLPQTRAAYRRTDEMLRFLSGWFGPYPFGAYGVAVLPAGVDVPALETATLSTMPVNSSREEVALHELAHQWFGNAATPRTWADVWLSEGPATYAELLWAEAQGADTGAIAARWYASLQQRGSRPLVATQAGQLFDASAYRRGALALHALRVAVGDAAFRAFLHAYTARFSGGNVDTAGFLALVRDQTGAGGEAAVRPWVESAELPPLPVLPP